MKNVIPGRILDFLQQHPPFQHLSTPFLRKLVEEIEVQYIKSDTPVFHAGDLAQSQLYMVRQGAVHLYRETENERTLVDTCDEGDLFGFRPLLADRRYMLSAVTTEESLLYAIPSSLIEAHMAENPDLALYVARSIAADTQRRYQSMGEMDTESDGFLSEVQLIKPKRAPVTCLEHTLIKDAAARMSQQQVSSIVIVDSREHPIGILTDKDLRRQVATGKVSIDQTVTTIMSSPVFTVKQELTAADLQIAMVKNHIHHLVLTADGTDGSPVSGILTEHDLLVAQGNNPAVLIRRIRRARDTRELAAIRERSEQLLGRYIQQEVSIAYISTVMTQVNDALMRRVIDLVLMELDDEPPVPFCWLALGSQGREEQLLRTDQDNALIFSEVAPERLDKTRSWFLAFAKKVTDGLHACGFAYCPADMMASNPRWCLSLREWQLQFRAWLDEPDPQAVMYSTIFFDYRPVYGEGSLARALTSHIFQDLDTKGQFLTFLAKNALQNPPPLTFFRSFVVEKSGAHEDAFDIKARAMMPLADAARVLTLGSRLEKINNTFRRFEELAKIEPQNAELYEQAADAYEILMRYRTLHGLDEGDSGRYIRPDELSKMERLNLRHAFSPIQKLQNLLMMRYKLAYLM